MKGTLEKKTLKEIRAIREELQELSRAVKEIAEKIETADES